LLGSTKQVLLRTPHRTVEEKEGKTSSRQNMGMPLMIDVTESAIFVDPVKNK